MNKLILIVVALVLVACTSKEDQGLTLAEYLYDQKETKLVVGKCETLENQGRSIPRCIKANAANNIAGKQITFSGELRECYKFGKDGSITSDHACVDAFIKAKKL